MADSAPQFEVTDELGSTQFLSGSVGTTPIDLPSVATGNISHFAIKCPRQIPITKFLSLSIDGGTTWATFYPGEAMSYPLRGNITQVKIKGNVSTVDYELFLSVEPV